MMVESSKMEESRTQVCEKAEKATNRQRNEKYVFFILKSRYMVVMACQGTHSTKKIIWHPNLLFLSKTLTQIRARQNRLRIGFKKDPDSPFTNE